LYLLNHQTVANYAGRIITVNNATASITLPSIIATAYPASSGPSGEATTTIAVGLSASNATNLIAAASVSATATSVNPTVPASAGAWRTVGTDDVQLYGITVANGATAGKARIVVTYSQAATLAANKLIFKELFGAP
jgi:hypothetical protein